MKAKAIESYLVEHIDKLDYVIDDVVSKIPDNYFYQPEINLGVLFKKRQQLITLRSKMYSFAYHNDKNVKVVYNKSLSEYNDMLSELVSEKRSSWKKSLMASSDEEKVAFLSLMIYKYNLLKRLRVYR